MALVLNTNSQALNRIKETITNINIFNFKNCILNVKAVVPFSPLGEHSHKCKSCVPKLPTKGTSLFLSFC